VYVHPFAEVKSATPGFAEYGKDWAVCANDIDGMKAVVSAKTITSNPWNFCLHDFPILGKRRESAAEGGGFVCMAVIPGSGGYG